MLTSISGSRNYSADLSECEDAKEIRKWLRPDEIDTFDVFVMPGLTVDVHVRAETREHYLARRTKKRVKGDKYPDDVSGEDIEFLYNMLVGTTIYSLCKRLAEERKAAAGVNP